MKQLEEVNLKEMIYHKLQNMYIKIASKLTSSVRILASITLAGEHSTYKYCHNTCEYWSGEYTPNSFKWIAKHFFPRLNLILIVFFECLETLYIDTMINVIKVSVKYINPFPEWYPQQNSMKLFFKNDTSSLMIFKRH